jgi:hypothetical protein|tara:strand:+ start:13828 stop:15375 length:1548 start_codon:yes stop_codon:yes gene_type:complete
MAAVVTDQFRISNANNFVDSVANTSNSYYVFLGLPNPANPVSGFGRTTSDAEWNSNTPTPTDNLQFTSQYRDTALFGKKVTTSNVRRLIRKVNWASNTRYDMYRHDYSISNPAPNSNLSRLYDTNYYVINSDFRVYICIDNGSSGSNLKGNVSKDEPTFTDLEPSAAGTSGDGYIWKYLFSVSPSDIIKFDSTEYVVVPNDWSTTTDTQIQSIREAGDSDINLNQIKKVYVANGGSNYTSGIVAINGDGSGAKVLIDVDSSGTITSATVTAGGFGYTYGIVDLGSLQPSGTLADPANLIPIIPPSRGHGYDIYTELGTDKILIYARFDDSNKDFPIDTKFTQVGILKNPQQYSSTTIYTANQYSSLFAVRLNSVTSTPVVGAAMSQSVSGGAAKGYVASYDDETKVLKYFQDRSLYFGNTKDHTDIDNVSSNSKILSFESSGNNISPFTGSIDTGFSGIKTTVNSKEIDLGINFTNGLANPEINKKTGEIIYIDNRPLIQRDSRQKEDVKIILEF